MNRKKIGFFYRLNRRIENFKFENFEVKYIKSRLKFCGKDVVISKNCIIDGLENICIGNNTFIGPECLFYSTCAKLYIGEKVIIGPRVSIVTGDHRFDVIGQYICENQDKLPENDKDVVIEDDVWIGMNVSIYKGVRIGKGSVIAGSSVVVKDVPPYSIYISKNRIYPRFSNSEIIEHERILKEREQKK